MHPFLPSNPVQINLTLLLRNSDQIKVSLRGDDNSGASKFSRWNDELLYLESHKGFAAERLSFFLQAN